GVFFPYAKGSDSNFLAANLDQTEANDSAAIKYSGGTLESTGASVTISQTQGPTPGTMTIAAFDVAGAPQQKAFVDGISTGTGIGAPVALTSVTIHKANGTTESEAAGGPDTSANISFTGGVAKVSGLGAGDRIEWTTAAPHDRVLIEGAGGKFDVGAFDITQGSSASVDIGQQLRFEDDGPTVTLTANTPPTVTDDESNFNVDNTGDFSGQFTEKYGTDGPAASGSLTYALDTVGGNSNLTDTLTQQTVVVAKEGNNVVGRAGGAIVFVVSVNPTTGVVTLDQQRAVVHPDTTNPDDTVTLSGNNLVKLTATAKDGDLDTAAQTIDITSSFAFKDDGPKVSLTGNTPPTVTDDESNFNVDNTGDFSGQFSASFGADGPAGSGSLTYALDTVGGNSNLKDTATGQTVVMSKDGNDVVG